MKTGIIIPTFNEEKHIAGILSALAHLDLPVVVLDDGSSDNTAKTAQKYRVTVIRNEANIGKGATLRNGFEHALQEGWDALINMDGDGQHSANDIPAFLKASQNPDVDIVIGNRMANTSRMPFIRILTNKFMSALISMLTGQHIPDSQCGFRLIKCRVLKEIRLQTSKYETESEMIIKAAKYGFKIVSIPIETIYNNEKSSINPIKDTFRFLRLLFRELGGKK